MRRLGLGYTSGRSTAPTTRIEETTLAAGGGRIVWVGRVISALVSIGFAISAFMKMKGGDEVAQGMAHLELPESLILPLAILEFSCMVIYLIPATSVLGAILLTGYMGGRSARICGSAIRSSSRPASEFSSGSASIYGRIA